MPAHRRTVKGRRLFTRDRRGGPVALLAVALATCTRPTPPLQLPDAAAVSRIEVVRWDSEGQRRSTGTSADAALIEQLLEHLAAHNLDYSADWPRRDWPAQEYTISFETRDAVPLVVWVGRDWLGGVDGELETGGRQRLARRRPLGPEERERLVALLPAPSP